MFTTEQNKTGSLADVQVAMRGEGRTRHLSRVLSNSDIGLKRVDFDPTNEEHRLLYTRFLLGGGWKDGVTFNIEAPHLTVPSTVVNKLLRHMLAKEIEQVESEQAQAELVGKLLS
jgi:hypothetical protein